MNIQTIKNVATADCKPLYLPHSLYLKPLAKIHLSVALPSSITGKTICNWDVMEKLRNLILPDTFAVLRVSKTTIEFIRLEAEVEDRSHLKTILNRLDGSSIKLPGFSENMRIRASEPKDDFATRHDWDSFFRDARNMDEMKAGERPDTVYISNLPIKWFCPRHQVNADHPKPSENIFKRIFEKFGDVRCVDIPICDPYRGQMKSNMTGLKSFSVDNETYFEGYVQFNEYLGFVKAMDEFRGMKLVHKEGEFSQAINIIVDFDKTKHLSDASIKRRKVVRDRLIEKEREVEEEERKKREQLELKKRIEQEKIEAEKRKEAEKQMQREARRKEKQLKKLKEKECMDFQSKIIAEEKKLLQAQRKLESIRLLEALFARIQLKTKNTVPVNDRKADVKPPRDLRDKLVTKYKNAHEGEFKKRMDKVRKAREGKVILTDLLAGDGKRSPSIDSISSDDSLFDESKKKKKKKKRSSSTSSSSSSSSATSTKAEKKNDPNPPGVYPPQPFHPSMYNPEMGDWYGMNMYPPYGAAPGYFPNTMPPNFYPGNGFNPNYRGRGRGRSRGRGFYRGSRYRDYDRHDYDRRSRSRTRSYSRSRSRSRSPRRRHRSHQESRKLVSTLRSRRTSSSPETGSKSRRRSRSRSLSRSRRRSRSSSSSSGSSGSRYRGRSSRRRSSREKRNGSEKPDKKETGTPPPISERKEHVSERADSAPRERDRATEQVEQENKVQPDSSSRKRSASVDSAKFMSPKRKERSKTPEWSNKN